LSCLAELIESARPRLMRYARMQLRNDAWAEDAVSETLLAAVEKPESFDGRSQPLTWLVGILKHKIVDQLRRRAREVPLVGRGEDDEGAAFEAAMFDDSGHFVEMPATWGDPQACLGERQFIEVLDACVEKLPERLGRVFMMREWLELKTAQTCDELQVTPGHLAVMMHRARLRLRECLQLHWFGEQASSEC
jgi:RNA polymerase sigma-70 factor (ECF subfamily)